MRLTVVHLRRGAPARQEPGSKTGYYGPESEERVKPLRGTAHALAALVDRGIDLAEVEQAISVPELSVVDSPQRAVLMRRYFDIGLRHQMLLRVVVEETPDEQAVYKTSQIAKYLNRTLP